MKNLITFKDPKSIAAEAYRTLRTNIQFSSIDREIKSIMVTSSVPGEGKSTTISNLAITMAQNGKKVLLVDCDLRKPNIHKLFGIPNSTGLTNILVQDNSLEECVRTTEIKDLYVITSGPIPPNPAELLNTAKMKKLMEYLITKFDIVLIDAPPVHAVSDPKILSTLVDRTILVTAYGDTQKQALLKAKEGIEQVGGKILGVVVNKIPENTGGSYNHYYYYNY